jgi:hypothetical protein
VVCCILFVASPARSQTPELCPDQIEVSGSFKIPYCHSHPLDAPQSQVTRAVIAIHGAERRATVTYAGVVAAAQASGEDGNTLIIAPQFLNQTDIGLPDDILYWTGTAWRFGNRSVNGPRISSYEVLDRILALIVDSGNFPSLSTVVVAGHSAGGQSVQRFAGATPSEAHISGDLGLSMRFVVMNPGSWLYLDPARWDPETASFAPPDSTSCPGYDDYGFGLQANLNEYMRAVGADAIRAQFGQRRLAYLLGDQDICLPDEVCTTPPGSPPPDGGCAASLQGQNRFERGTRYYQYAQYFYSTEILDRHSLEIVPGVGHDGTAMFTSDGSLRAIFDYAP